MDVNINGIRIRLAKNTDKLIKKLNAHITEDNFVSVPVEDIEETINDIRQLAWVLCCVFDKNHGDEFREVWEDVGDIATFNPQEDEEE